VGGRRHRHRERAFHWARRSVKREFADDGILIEQLTLELPAAGEDAEGNREIERTGALGQLGRIAHSACVCVLVETGPSTAEVPLIGATCVRG
jgi:hypothetical protein